MGFSCPLSRSSLTEGLVGSRSRSAGRSGSHGSCLMAKACTPVGPNASPVTVAAGLGPQCISRPGVESLPGGLMSDLGSGCRTSAGSAKERLFTSAESFLLELDGYKASSCHKAIRSLSRASRRPKLDTGQEPKHPASRTREQEPSQIPQRLDCLGSNSETAGTAAAIGVIFTSNVFVMIIFEIVHRSVNYQSPSRFNTTGPALSAQHYLSSLGPSESPPWFEIQGAGPISGSAPAPLPRGFSSRAFVCSAQELRPRLPSYYIGADIGLGCQILG